MGNRFSRRRSRKYRQLEHTADLGLRVWGGSPEELFENAAAALVATMTDRRRLRVRASRRVELEAPDREALLVAWLNHLLYLFDVEGLLGRRFKIDSLRGGRLSATVQGEPFDPGRHVSKTAVKAATHHLLEISRQPQGWQARIILDL